MEAFRRLEAQFYRSDADWQALKVKPVGHWALKATYWAAVCSSSVQMRWSSNRLDSPSVGNNYIECGQTSTDCGPTGGFVYTETKLQLLKKPIKLVARILVYIYMLLVLTEICYCSGSLLVGTQWKRAYAEWAPQVRQDSPRSKNCLVATDLVLGEPTTVDYQRTVPAKSFFGLDVILRFTSITQALFAIRIIGWLLVALGGVVLSFGRPIELPAFSFLVEPQSERTRIRLELAKVIQSSFAVQDPIEQQASELKNTLGLANCRKFHLKATTSSRHHHRQTKWQPALIRRQSRLQFRSMVVNNRLALLVHPKSLANSSLQAYHLTLLVFFVAFFSLDLVNNLISVSSTISRVLKLRLAERLKQVDCERWQPGGLLAKTTLHFDDSFWLTNRHLYYNHKPGDETSKLLVLELVYLLSDANTCFALTMLLLTNLFYPLVTIVSKVVFAVCYHYQLVWLTDLEQQMQLLNNLLSHQLSVSKQPKEEEEEADSTLLLASHKAMALVYFNFELFRRQYETFRHIGSLIASYIILQSMFVVSLLCLAYSHKTPEVHKRHLIEFMLFIMLYINVMYVSSSALIVRVQRLSVGQLQLLARLAELSISLSHIGCLWRRQLQNEADIRSDFALTLFGFELSPTNLLTVNSYLLGFGLLLYNTYTGG